MTHPVLSELRRRRRPRRAAAPSRWRAWAGRVAGRYARIIAFRAAAGALVRHAASPRPDSATAPGTSARATAHIRLALAATHQHFATSPRRPHGPAPRGVLHAPRPPLVGWRRFPAPPRVTPHRLAGVRVPRIEIRAGRDGAPSVRPGRTVAPAAQASRESIVRLVGGRRRLDAPPAYARGRRPVPAGSAAAPAPATAMPLHPPPALAPVARELAVPAVTPAAEPRERRRAAAPPAPSAPPLDLERLTDQVVRQIDRRIVAHRERLGRI